MTTFISNNQAGVRCDSCGTKQMTSNSNVVRAQRVAVNFFGWRVYNEKGEWRHSCSKCVKIWKQQQETKQ